MKVLKCEVSLRSIVKIIAVFEMVLCIVLIIPITLIMLEVCFEGFIGVFVEFAFGVPRSVQLSIWLAYWMVIVMKFLLDVNLYRGTNSKNYDASQIWLIVTSGVLITLYIWSILSLNMFWTKRGCLTMIMVDIIIGMYKGLEMVAVYKYMQKMKKGERLSLFTTRATAPISITEFNFDHHRGSDCMKSRQSNTVENDEQIVIYANELK